MNRNTILLLAAALLMPFTASAQVPVAPAYGSLSASPESIVFVDQNGLIVLNVDNDGRAIVELPGLQGTGAIGYLGGSQWLFGKVSAAEEGAGDVFVFDAATGTIGAPITNLNDVRDMAIVSQGDRLDAIVADRANDTVSLITDVLGSADTTDITPSSIAGNVGIQGLVALSDSLYFLYDELPDDGFGSDELIVVDGGGTDAATTRLSWNAIGDAGAGLATDELSVDFHNGLAVRQPDASTIVMYLSNFGAFSNSQVIEVTWTDSGNGFDFSSPTTRVLLTETNLFDAIADNNGDAADVAALANSRGVLVIPGETVADDRLAIWVDDTDNGNTYMVLYDLAADSFSLFGGDALENVLLETNVTNWETHR